MVQLSPDTRLRGWDGCSGYHYSDHSIYGFSHTHLSGTGVSDYGDVLLMPTVGKVKWNNSNYASDFQKENEHATAGYYSVFLDKPGVLAELTATARTGLHKYTFPKTDAANIILDLNHRDRLNEGEITISGDSELSGYRISTKWASNQHVYFVIQFSRPFQKSGIAGCGPHVRSKHTKGGRLKGYV
jgi:putative alpha-1,2-mannosidase